MDEVARFPGDLGSFEASSGQAWPELGKTNVGTRLTVARALSRPPSETRGSNSVVECNLAKVDVEGSNPFSRSAPKGMSQTMSRS